MDVGGIAWAMPDPATIAIRGHVVIVLEEFISTPNLRQAAVLSLLCST